MEMRLRGYKQGDIEVLYNYFQDRELRENLMVSHPFPFTQVGMANFVNSSMEPKPDRIEFAIENQEGVLVGGCSIKEIDYKNSNASLGLFFGKEHQGKGYGQKALKEICKYIFEELNLHKVKLRVFKFNVQGINCYKKVGFVQEGIARKEIFRRGEYHDSIIMGLLREEFKG